MIIQNDNDIHDKETIKDSMAFEVTSIFRHRSLDPKPADWPEESWKKYLAWRDENPWVEVSYVLKDENGILSTTGPGGLLYTYDVTDNRDLIIKDYSYNTPPKLREKLIAYLKDQGISKQEEIDETLKQTISIIATKTRFTVRELKEPCSDEITTYCGDIDNGYELIDCLRNNQKNASSDCKSILANHPDKQP